jgi:hypothetical protein
MSLAASGSRNRLKNGKIEEMAKKLEQEMLG